MSAKQPFYNRQGNPLTTEEWMESFDATRNDSSQIAENSSADGLVRVSTVWLMGVNQNFSDGPPLLYETMIFGGPNDLECWRWSTEAEARAGHAEICSSYLRGQGERA